MSKLQDRRVLVTGASRGIGRAAALAFARRGSAVVLASRGGPELELARRACAALGVDAQAVALDVTDDDSVRDGVAAALARGPIDVLVNNAGVYGQGRFLTQDPAWRRREMDVNYFGAQRVTCAVLPSMLARRRGTIVNVSSIVGEVPCPTVANYCGTKAALAAWSHALRGELAGSGVRVVVFLPGRTDTDGARSTRLEGVRAVPVEVTAEQLLWAVARAPRSFAPGPLLRVFLRLAGLFPTWAEGRMRAATRALLAESA